MPLEWIVDVADERGTFHIGTAYGFRAPAAGSGDTEGALLVAIPDQLEPTWQGEVRGRRIGFPSRTEGCWLLGSGSGVVQGDWVIGRGPGFGGAGSDRAGGRRCGAPGVGHLVWVCGHCSTALDRLTRLRA